MDMDNGTTTTAMASDLYLAHMAHLIFMSYIVGILGFFAAICDIVIVAVFTRSKAGKCCGKSTRLYYVLIALSDLINIVDMQLIISFLDFGLEYLTGGTFNPGMVERLNGLTCKIFWYPYFVTEQLSGFTLATFSLERFCAVYYPMKVKTMWAYKNVKIGLSILATIIVLWNVHILVSIEPVLTLGSTSYKICQSNPSDSTAVVLFWITYGIFNYGIPTTLVCTINVCILIRMLRASRHRSTMMSGELSSAESQKQKVATTSLVLLACIHAVIFMPATVALTLEALVSIGLVPLGQTSFATLVEIGYACFHFTAVSKILNFFIYYYRVPYFNQTLRSCFKSETKEAS